MISFPGNSASDPISPLKDGFTEVRNTHIHTHTHTHTSMELDFIRVVHVYMTELRLRFRFTHLIMHAVKYLITPNVPLPPLGSAVSRDPSTNSPRHSHQAGGFAFRLVHQCSPSHHAQ